MTTLEKRDIAMHGKTQTIRIAPAVWDAFLKTAKVEGLTVGQAAAKAQPLRNQLGEAVAEWTRKHSAEPVYTHASRDSWLAAVVDAMRPIFAGRGFPLPEHIQATMGFPSTGWRGKRRGECWGRTMHAKGWIQIFIHPCEIDQTRIVNILTHELCHAAHDEWATSRGKTYKAGHGKQFAMIGSTMDLEGKPAQMLGAAAWEAWALPLIAAVGPMCYAALAEYAAKPKVQTTRMLKFECMEDLEGGCGAVWRMSAKHVAGKLVLSCPCCGNKMQNPHYEEGDEDDGEGE